MLGVQPQFVLTSATLLIALCLLFYGLHRRLHHQKRQRIQRNIEQLALLRKLVAGLQKHRGLSNGALCGDESLRQDLAAARARLDGYIQEAQAMPQLSREAWSGLIDHWSRLRDGRTSDPTNNLVQHHLIIGSAIFLMEDVAADIDLRQGRPELSYLPCIWREVVQAAEWSGQARALGTGIAAAGHSSAEQRVRLRFLYQKITQLSDTAFSILHGHATEHPRFSDFRLAQCEKVVGQLLSCIDQELLGKEKPTISAKTYFQQATHAIDELFALVDVSLRQMNPKP